MDSNPEYRKWLLGKLAQRDFLVTRDFKELILTEDLIPHEFRSKPTGEIILEIYAAIKDSEEFKKGKNYYEGLSKYLKEQDILFPFKPSRDGVDHINIYSRGKTAIGRDLSNFSKLGFHHKNFGEFQSVEGFWYWLATGLVDDNLRDLYGFQAKEYGRKLERVEISDFKQQVKKAILLKVEQNELLRQALLDVHLPFTHYYFYGNEDNAKVMVDDKSYWFVEWVELVRRWVQKKAYKTIIAGSRSITRFDIVKTILECAEFDMIEVVSGKAQGIDTLGERFANTKELPIEEFPADWDSYGKSAGHIRNSEMANYADALIAIWDGKSPGTKNMVQNMRKLNKPVELYMVKEDGSVCILNETHIL